MLQPNDFCVSVCVDSTGFLIYKIMSFVTAIFIPSFTILVPSTSFSCMTALARTSDTMSNSSGGSDCSHFVPDLGGKILSLHH